MELMQWRYEREHAFTEHGLVLDDDGVQERALCEETPTMAALLELSIEDVDEVVGKQGTAILDAEHWKMQRGHLEDAICTRCLAGAMLARGGVADRQVVTIILDDSQVDAYEGGRTETGTRGHAVMEAGSAPSGSVAARMHAVDDLAGGERLPGGNGVLR